MLDSRDRELVPEDVVLLAEASGPLAADAWITLHIAHMRTQYECSWTRNRDRAIEWWRAYIQLSFRVAEAGQIGRVSCVLKEMNLATLMLRSFGADTMVAEVDASQLVSRAVAALPLSYAEAAAAAPGWRELPMARIRALREAKNIVTVLERLVLFAGPLPVEGDVRLWSALKPTLP